MYSGEMNGELLTFAGVMALGQFSPGPDMVLLTRTSLKKGARAGVETALGIACGLAVHSTLAVAGLALVFERLPVLRRAMCLLAAGYLLWLAYSILREVLISPQVGGNADANGRESSQRPFLRGLFCNLLNPKVAIILMAVCAPFLKGERPGWWPFALWMIIVGQGCVLWSLWACLLQWTPLRRIYDQAVRWIDAAFALVLALLALLLIIG